MADHVVQLVGCRIVVVVVVAAAAAATAAVAVVNTLFEIYTFVTDFQRPE